jgi:hypothetical protein
MLPHLTEEQRQAFADALYGGRKIEAIRQLRQVSGLGLKEAKEMIERLEADLRAAHPERFPPPSQKGIGCALLLAVAVAAVMLFWLFKR